jgi:hypothetical protein
VGVLWGKFMPATQPTSNSALPVPRDGRDPTARANFLPYPVSTLAPAITATDLGTFRSRGTSEAGRMLRQELLELQEKYTRAVDRYNWNQLVYAAEFRFEPVIGETYHLYADGDRQLLSMIAPGQWNKTHLGSFRLNVDRSWEIVALADGIDRAVLFGG